MPPPLNVTGDPKSSCPSMNWTVPVGKLPVTLAVKVTACPTVDGSSDDARVVVVFVVPLGKWAATTNGERLFTDPQTIWLVVSTVVVTSTHAVPS